MASYVTGLLSKTMGEGGKYTALMVGIANVVGNEPDYRNVLYAGIGFLAATGISGLGSLVLKHGEK